MKDYADKGWLIGKPTPTEDKLGRSIGYLMSKGIYRGSVDCNHVYRNSDGHVVTKIEPSKTGVPF